MLSMGMTVMAAELGNGAEVSYDVLKVDDIVAKDTVIGIPAGFAGIIFGNDDTGEETTRMANARKTLSECGIFPADKYRVTAVDVTEGIISFAAVVSSSGSSDSSCSSDTMTDEEREEMEREQREAAWRVSPNNPDNYLPKIIFADGTELRSTIPSHFHGDKDSSVKAVLVTTPEQDVKVSCDITGSHYAHINAFTSQCGPKLRDAFTEYAASFGTDVTVCDIIEQELEEREKGTYQLYYIIEQSAKPLDMVYALTGKALTKAQEGMELALICYADGELTLLEDVDTQASTITVNTDKVSGTYAIIAAPKGRLP